MTVKLPAPKQAGDQLSLAIAYGGKPHVAKKAPWDGGFVWATPRTASPWVATAVEGEGCDLFWPCFDNSMVEADLVTQHIIVPKGLAAPGNGACSGSITSQTGGTRMRTTGARKHPEQLRDRDQRCAVSTCARRLSEPLRQHHPDPVSGTCPGRSGRPKELFAEIPDDRTSSKQKIGPYPFGDEKMGVVETPHLGMEHQTINAYGNDYKSSA